MAERQETLDSYPKNLVEIRDLTVRFRAKDKSFAFASKSPRLFNAVDNVSFSIRKGETFGLVGETGSGKTTIAKTLVGLNRPSIGTVKILGRTINFRKKRHIRFLRENVGIVFQDPVGSLNPRLSVRDIIAESLIASRSVAKAEFEERIESTVEQVGLRKSALQMHPRELSGGERQRVSLARALVIPKKLLILDEPTSSLDMTIQAQVLNTLRRLKSELHLSYLFITHDINVVRYMSSRISFLFYGRLVEVGGTYDVLSSPMHPYSRELLSNTVSIVHEEEKRTKVGQTNEILIEHKPSPTGCVYRDVCPNVFDPCGEKPALAETTPGHLVACFLHHSLKDTDGKSIEISIKGNEASRRAERFSNLRQVAI